jgi:hypothetical protein
VVVLVNGLSGNLLKMQHFQGTICEIKEFEYLRRKLNGQLPPAVDEAAQAENQMMATSESILMMTSGVE